MADTDLKAERKDLYAPRRGVFVDIVVPPMTFLAIDGTGDPNLSEDYRHAIEALFSASYAAKFLSRRELQRDYMVLALEGRWWADDMAAFHTRDKTSWSWRMMIRQPNWPGAEVLKSGGAEGTTERCRRSQPTARYSPDCTSTYLSTRSSQQVCTTRSTSVMLAAPRRQSSAQSCVNP